MRKLELDEIKGIELRILTAFRDYCNEHKLAYFISNGTLLGAVKYGGFIPWDDDIDVLMPRRDYDRFLSEYKDNEEYTLFSKERGAHYQYPFAKLCRNGTLKLENDVQQDKKGIDIDIIPLDGMGNVLVFAKLRAAASNCMIKMLCLSLNEDFYSRSRFKRAVYSICRIVGRSDFIHKTYERMVRPRYKDSRYVGNLIWAVYGAKEVMPARLFSTMTEVSFEGKIFSAPIGYDLYLRSLYGDYKKDPPPDKCVTHHEFAAYVTEEGDET